MIAWLHSKVGLLPLYPSVAQMPPETARLYLHLVRQDVQTGATATAHDLAKKHDEMMGKRPE